MELNMTNSKKQITTGIVLIAIGVTALLCITFLITFSDGNPLQTAGEVFEFEPEQVPLMSSINSSISIPGFESLLIPANESTVPAYLYNPDNNQCYFEISILLSGEDTPLYKSSLVSPGQKLYEIKLSRTLDQGIYEAILHYKTYSLNDFSPMNGANIPFSLIVDQS